MVSKRGSGGPSALVDRIRDAARAGVDLIQIRERDLDARALLQLTTDARRAVEGTAARIVVNDWLDVALAGGAAGVHLRGDSFAAADARRLAGESFLIGRSVHSEDEAAQVEADGGCDYLLFGTVFPSSGKPAGHPVAGMDALGRVCARVALPVLAIGGINEDNAAAAFDAGAAGVAGIDLFAAGNLAARVARLRSADAGRG